MSGCESLFDYEQLAKSGLSLEVDCGELGGRVLTALRAERWRTAAEHALRSPSKTTSAPPLSYPVNFSGLIACTASRPLLLYTYHAVLHRQHWVPQMHQPGSGGIWSNGRFTRCLWESQMIPTLC